MGTVSFEVPGPGTYNVTCDPKLDPLANSGTAGDILSGKQFYNDQNQVVTGTLEPVAPTYAGILVVTVDAGAEVTATDGTTTLTAISTGTATFHLPNGGTWTVSATLNGSQATPATVEVQENFSVALSAGASQTVSVPTQYEAELSFDQIYTITLTIDPAGSGTVTGAGQYQEGTQATVTAIQADGYEFTAWKETGESRLPTGYTELEYIQSSGTQYINTGWDPTTQTKTVLDLKITETDNAVVFGSKVEYGDRQKQYFVYAMPAASRFEANYFYRTEANLLNLTDYKQRGILTFDQEALSFNGSTAALNYTHGAESVSVPIYLFGYNLDGSANSLIKMILYSCQIYEGGTLVRNFVPCSDPSGSIGLYDLVDGMFYASAGTGTLTAGPAIGGDITVSENPEYTFTVTGDRDLVAVFEEIGQYEPGVDWWETPLSSSANWRSVTYGGGKFVAVAYGSNNVAYSTDGITWKAATLPSSASWYSVTYGTGKFVAVARDSAKAAYSEDGITWTAAVLPSSSKWYCVTYGGGKFVATMSGSNKAAYSVDGITWISTTMPSSAGWRSVTYGNGKFVAVAYSSDKAAYSTDGITWTAATMPYSVEWGSVTYGDGKFVAVGGLDKAAYSADGITWTAAATMPSDMYWYGATYGSGKFVAMGGHDNAAYSTDGINWTAATMPSDRYWYSVTYGGGKFVAVAYGNATAAYSSAKGPGV